MTYAAIALGSNLGNSYDTLINALDRLNQIPGIEVAQQSSIYLTKPIGPPQPDYLNACAVLDAKLDPHGLLHTLLQIESEFGRVRRIRWGARTLDLDLLLYGDRILTTADLELPHPRMRERAFVMIPLAEIAGDWIDPVTQRAIADLASQVDRQAVRRLETPEHV